MIRIFVAPTTYAIFEIETKQCSYWSHCLQLWKGNLMYSGGITHWQDEVYFYPLLVQLFLWKYLLLAYWEYFSGKYVKTIYSISQLVSRTLACKISYFSTINKGISLWKDTMKQNSDLCMTSFLKRYQQYVQWVILKIVSEYYQEIPQSQTADNPVAPRGRAAQPSRDNRKTN